MNLPTGKWDNESYNSFINNLIELSDLKYRKFHMGIVPDINNLIGIRMPVLRSIAKEIAGGDWQSFLLFCQDRYYEEIMIQGIIIGLIKTDFQHFIELIFDFSNKINNWAICDSFCSGLKNIKYFNNEFFVYLNKYIYSDKPWQIRVGLVCILFHYIDDKHIEDIIQKCDQVENTHYYVKMAKAWLVAECYIKFPDITLEYLINNNHLDNWTYNKSIQKIRESKRISDETKEFLKTLKKH